MIYWLLKAFRWLRMSYQTVANRWIPEVKKLNDQLEKLQDSLAGTDDCVVDIYSLEERLEEKVELLEEELARVKAQSLEDKVEKLEEELESVKAQNAELRNHLNPIIKELNAVVEFLNNNIGDLVEHTYEIDSTLKESS